MRVSLAPSLAVLVLAGTCVADVAAQSRPWTWSVAVSRSTGSRSATGGPSCDEPCTQPDVLSPVSLTTFEVELSRPLARRGSLGLDHHVRVVPAAFARGNPVTAASWTSAGWRMPFDTERSSTVGAGVEPLGLTLWVGSEKLRFEADASLGLIAFLDPFLARNATRVNAMYEGGIGAQVAALRLGYRRRHISNAGFGEVNPGLDAHVLFVGWVF